ncbi:type-F conjugative transfer system pilin assembly protein TrbC [Candidatus Rariloculus sp.]|uniref:type-F conjugative transfer system pilin assembly protein TrbC n=1 Tax=Candidatus Rariloculus sp. TaxID=3101265 RepID=UPI003D10E4AA
MNKPQIITTAAMCCAWCVPAIGQQSTPDVERTDAEADAQALVDAVLGESLDKILAEEHEALADWAQTVIEQALSSGPEAGPALVPGGPTPSALAQGFAGNRANTAEVLVFMSLSVPEPSWRQWSREAARIGAPMVLRGVAEGGLTATVNRIAARHAEDGAGAGIDPRLFRLFRIGSVPAVAVIPGGVRACTTPGCSSDPPPPHDLVTGNIGLDGALEAIATEGGPGRDTAIRQLAVLRGETH